MQEEIIARTGEIIAAKTGGGNEGYCSLALIDVDGYPAISTISVSKADGIKRITFCTGLHGKKTTRIAKDNRAAVCFNALDYNISLIGTIEVITNADIKKVMWYSGLSNHFSGPDDPGYCVLRFTTERYNLLVDWKEAIGCLT